MYIVYACLINEQLVSNILHGSGWFDIYIHNSSDTFPYIVADLHHECRVRGCMEYCVMKNLKKHEEKVCFVHVGTGRSAYVYFIVHCLFTSLY